MEKINPLDYIEQLEKENEDLKKKVSGLNINHHTDKSNPKYYELQKDYYNYIYNHKINFLKNFMKSYFVLLGIVVSVMFIICIIFCKVTS